MSQHMEDMSQVPDPGEVPPQDWYQVRIAKVTEGVSDKNQPIVDFLLKIQNEGPAMGRTINDRISLQPHVLWKLKAYYTAVGYKPAPGQGHDPDNCLDGECWVYAEHKIYDGQTRIDIKPHMIRSLQQGPAR